MPEVVVGCAGFIAILTGAEVLHRRWGIVADHTRRGAHVASGICAAALPVILTLQQIAAVAAVMTLALIASRIFRVFRSVHDVGRRTWGEVFFPLGLLLLASMSNSTSAYVFGSLVLALGDGGAGMIGDRCGRTPFAIGVASKSLQGTTAMLIISAPLAICGLALEGLEPTLALGAGLLIAIVLTGVEALLPLGADNLALPVTAGFLFERALTLT